jgi:hypothetical protein
MYLYSHKYEVPSGASDFEKRILMPIALHALADKYEITGLAEHAVEAFNCSCDHSYTPCSCEALDEEESKQMVEAHYQHCVEVDSLMGKAISDYIVRTLKTFLHSDSLVTLIRLYPVLGADIVLAEKRESCLGVCTRKHRVVSAL